MHTPGPWKWKEVSTSIGRAFKINTPEHLDDEHGLIACIYDDNTSLNTRSHDEHAANAKLIAAAPDLKSELIAYHDREWMDSHEGLPAHKAGEFPEECGGCAAIARAGGRA